MPPSDSSSAPRPPSVREVALAAKVSPITVSRALRGSPLVREEVRVRVLAVADSLGYVRNLLAGALMSEMRRSQSAAFRGVLAVLDLDGPVGRHPGANAYHAEMTRGAVGRAKELGFATDVITVGKGKLSIGRLDRILRSRGMTGLFLLPVREAPDLSRLDWAHFSGVYADYLIERPGLHTVCPDHYRAILTALERVRQLGYRRPGLVLSAFHNARLLHRPSAAYEAFQANHEDTRACPVLRMWRFEEADFAAWFRETKCDVVLSNLPEVLDWMRKSGARVPETQGFCCLNLQTAKEPCAGLDLQPGLLGARGMELLIGMVLRNERGAPEQPMTALLPARWMDGPTLRDQRAPGEETPLSGVWRWAPPPGRKSGEYPPAAENAWPWKPKRPAGDGQRHGEADGKTSVRGAKRRR